MYSNFSLAKPDPKPDPVLRAWVWLRQTIYSYEPHLPSSRVARLPSGEGLATLDYVHLSGVPSRTLSALQHR